MDTETTTFAIVFIIIIFAIIVYFIYISAKRANFKREAAHALSANAIVIAKRSQIRGGHETTFTDYFVTFDIEGIGRAEFNVAGNFSGLLVEGDHGIIRFLLSPLRIVDFTPAPRFQQIQQ